jgi:hypothetical protein
MDGRRTFRELFRIIGLINVCNTRKKPNHKPYIRIILWAVNWHKTGTKYRAINRANHFRLTEKDVTTPKMKIKTEKKKNILRIVQSSS